jgi:Fe(3+) dicitrate transport protein
MLLPLFAALLPSPARSPTQAPAPSSVAQPPAADSAAQNASNAKPSAANTSGANTPDASASSSAAQESQDGPTPEVIVTGTLEQQGVPKVAIDYPASRDVLGPEEVARIGARDLNDLVQYLPAVSTRPYNGGDASAPSFSMRGLPDDGLTEYALVLIDGVPASPMPYGWTAFSFFPLITEQVYAIDLVRGGQAVRYSPNNVAGALNLITAPIPESESYELRSTVGSYGYFSTVASAGNDDGKFGYLVTLGERHGDGYREQGDFEYANADVKLRWRLGDEDWLTWRTSYVENQHQAPGGLTLAQFDVDRFANARPLNQFRGFRGVTDIVRRIGDEQNFVEYFGWFSQTRRNLERTDPVFGAPPTNFRRTDDDAFSAAVGVRGGAAWRGLGMEHDLYWGVRVSEEWIPGRTTKTQPFPGGATATVGDLDYQLTALSAHVDDTFHPTEDWTVVAGVRAEWIPTFEAEDRVSGETESQDASALLPGLSTSYKLSDHLALFANYQESFRAPQVWGLDTTIADPLQSVDFEDGSSGELGLRAEGGWGLSGSVAVWRVDFEDVLFFNNAGVYENVGDIRSDGVDLVAGLECGEMIEALDGFSLQGSMTWQDSELQDAANPAFDGNETPYAWEEKSAWSLQYRTERWRFALGGVYVGDSFSDDANTEAENANGNLGRNLSRTVWDGQISREFGLGDKAVGRFSIGATNLVDKEWAVHSRGGFFGGGKVAGPPRQMYFGLQVSI